MTEQQYIHALKRFVQHKRVLSKHSDWYRSPQVSASLRVVTEVFDGMLRNCSQFDTRRICRMVLTVEPHLWNILPAPHNASRSSAAVVLSQLIVAARTFIAEGKFPAENIGQRTGPTLRPDAEPVK